MKQLALIQYWNHTSNNWNNISFSLLSLQEILLEIVEILNFRTLYISLSDLPILTNFSSLRSETFIIILYQSCSLWKKAASNHITKSQYSTTTEGTMVYVLQVTTGRVTRTEEDNFQKLLVKRDVFVKKNNFSVLFTAFLGLTKFYVRFKLRAS